LGDINRIEGNDERARDYYKQSLELRKQISSSIPDDSPALKDLATSYVKLGNTSDPKEARELFVDALEARKQIAEKTNNPNRHRDVWITLNKLAEIDSQMASFDASREYYAEALEKAKQLSDLVPDSFRAKLDLASAYVSLGIACDKSDRSELAGQSYANAIRLLNPLAEADSRNIEVHTYLALALARSGAHAAGAVAAEELRSLAPDNYRNLYNVACCYALCARAADGSVTALNDNPEGFLRDKYADKAIEVLNQAAENGLQSVESVASDSDLDAIRNHPSYQKLLEKLSATEQESQEI
jgi:tetratricopeptide (TPR) repeat protein